MGKSAAPAPAADPKPADPTPTPAADPTPAPAADPAPAPAPTPKPEKTYTKAEMDAAATKAAADALKKAEEEKDLSDLEKANNRIKELEMGNRLRDTKDVAVEALKKAGSNSPELLWKVMQSDIEFDDKGKPKNLEALVTSLKADYADQFGEPKPGETIDGGAGGAAPAATALTKEKLAKMKPSEINELDWEEVKKVMAAE